MKSPRIVFLLDVDNTLLDNDRITADLQHHLQQEVGIGRAQAYWSIFEELRTELGYADYLGALQRYRVGHPRDPHLLTVSRFLVNYPFADRILPGTIDVIAQLKQWGTAVILSDGDVVFQPLKIERSGLLELVDKQVLVYIHKELELDDVEHRHPADHYVIIDDKLRILAATKAYWGPRVTTVFPRQGHYANDPKIAATFPPADVNIERIDHVLHYGIDTLLSAAKPS